MLTLLCSVATPRGLSGHQPTRCGALAQIFAALLSGSTSEARCSWLPKLSPTRNHGFSFLDLLFCCGWAPRESWLMTSSFLLCEQDDVGYVFSVYQESIFASVRRTRKFKTPVWGHMQVQWLDIIQGLPENDSPHTCQAY